MPITKSAIKAMRQSLKRRQTNLKTLEKYKKALRDFRKLIVKGARAEAEKAMSTASSLIDKAVKKNQVHHNKASRLKARMAAAVKNLTK